MRKLLPILIFCLCLASCGDDSICVDPGDNDITPYPNMDIGDMRRLYNGSPSVVNRDVVIAGVVTANDLTGNFFRTFIIEDATGAIEIRAGLYDIKNLFPEGRYVVVKAAGLTVSDYNGVLQIGLAPSGGRHQADYFGNKAVMDRYVIRGGMETVVEPQIVTVGQLEDALCGRLVRMTGLTLKAGEPDTWASADEYTSYSSRVFTDGDGFEISVSTSKYASFAGNRIPDGRVSLTGILMKENNFALRIRGLGDVVAD